MGTGAWSACVSRAMSGASENLISDFYNNYPWNPFKLPAIQRRHPMTVRLGCGCNVKVALPDDLASALQLHPELRVFPCFCQRKRQHGVILQHAFHKTDTAFPDNCVRGAGAAMQEFRRRDGSDKKQIGGVRG